MKQKKSDDTLVEMGASRLIELPSEPLGLAQDSECYGMPSESL